ncbi:MAG: hypothetical protein JRC90_05745 [Deltaproteobacteria bacterium]|nr:hypothetical protein [Deltaproteobacteria bacterium]
MKRIIDGKVYDTETAELIEEESFSNPRDFHHTFQSLYKTKKGAYFFHGGGGPMTEYAIDLGNNNTGGSSNIWIVEQEDALKWLGKVNPEKALELFPDAFEDA